MSSECDCDVLRWEEEEEEASGTCIPSCVQSQVRLSLFNRSQSLPRIFSVLSVSLTSHKTSLATPGGGRHVRTIRVPQACEAFVTKLQKKTVN